MTLITQQTSSYEEMNKDKISVIIPTHQSAAYLQGTLESIQNQTHQELEIIVVDDGSKDNTVDLVKSLQVEDSRIQVYPLVHQGAPGHCRNFGFEKATSDFIIFFDSDDIMYPTMLENMLTVMKKDQVDLVIGNPRYVDMDTKESLPSQMEWFFAKQQHNITELFQISPFPCNKLYRTSFLKQTQVRYLEGVFNQDLGYFLCNLLYEPKFSIISDYVMDYMVRQGSITTSRQTRKKHIDIIAVFDQVFQEWDKVGKNPKFTYGIYHMFIRSMIFKASFFDLLEEQSYLEQIRLNLNKYCPNWYQEKAFKDFFPRKKQLYNRLILQYRCYTWIGRYKKWKAKRLHKSNKK